jgi:hypothetical protein
MIGHAAPAWLVPVLCLLVTGSVLGVSTTLAELAGGTGLAPLPFVAAVARAGRPVPRPLSKKGGPRAALPVEQCCLT